MTPTVQARGILGTAVDLAHLIRISHTIFSVPFALAAAAVAWIDHPIGWGQALLILGCLATARTAAMAYNRIADSDHDAKNPRTKHREIPRGVVSPKAAWALTLASGAAFLVCATLLSPLCGALSLVALPLALGYSKAKRFTWLCHFWLGVVLALAPIGAWVAITGRFDAFPLILGLGVVCWIGGFDITYGLADLEFDRKEGLHSFPVRWGPKVTIVTSRVLHVLAPALFLTAGLVAGRGIAYVAGVIACAIALLAGQIATARGAKGDAVLTANSWAALVFGIAAVVDVLVVGGGR